MLYNPFRDLYFWPNFKTGHIIQWSIDPLFKDYEPYVFTLQASGTPTFSELQFEIDAGNNLFVVDDTNFKQSLVDDFYYRVKLKTQDDTYYSQTLLFGTDRPSRHKYVLASELARKELLRIRKYAGFNGWLLKRKTSGKVARESVDEISGVPIVDNSANYGTEFENGYYPPLKVWCGAEQNKLTRKQDSSGLGVTELEQTSLRMVGFPSVNNDDIIVDGIRRYLIKDLQAVIFPGTNILTVQTMEAQTIPVTDPVYNIEIPN